MNGPHPIHQLFNKTATGICCFCTTPNNATDTNEDIAKKGLLPFDFGSGRVSLDCAVRLVLLAHSWIELRATNGGLQRGLREKQ